MICGCWEFLHLPICPLFCYLVAKVNHLWGQELALAALQSETRLVLQVFLGVFASYQNVVQEHGYMWHTLEQTVRSPLENGWGRGDAEW